MDLLLKKLFSELKEYYAVPEHIIANNDEHLFGRYLHNPVSLVQAMENEPDAQYWWAIWNSMDKRLGAGAADKLLMDVTIETILAHPFKVAVIYIRNFMVALVSHENSYVWVHPHIIPESIGYNLSDEMEKSGDCATSTKLGNFLNIYFSILQVFLLIIAILFSKKIWNSHRWRVPWIFCWALIIYNHLTIAIAAAPDSRYTFYIFPILLVIITIGLKTWQDREDRLH